MAWGSGTNPKAADIGIVQGKQKDIACECWFTSKGRTKPVLVKLEDEDGEIRTVEHIAVHSCEKKMYAGIPSMVYECTLEIGEKRMDARLIHYMTENRWVLNFQ